MTSDGLPHIEWNRQHIRDYAQANARNERSEGLCRRFASISGIQEG